MCLHPRQLYVRKYGRFIDIPCGKCLECQKTRQRNTVIRLREEFKDTSNKMAMFFTLTYEEENVPIATYEVKSFDAWNEGKTVTCRVLYRRDVQLFVKRVRKYCEDHMNGMKIRVFYCGEYGPKTLRPHYHGIIFFPEFVDAYKFKSVLQSKWSKGYVTAKKCDDNASFYVSKYTNAVVANSDFFRNLPREFRPFRVSPKHMGLAYLTEAKIKYFREQYDLNNYEAICYTFIIKDKPVRVPLPPPFLKKIFHPMEKDFIAFYWIKQHDKKTFERYDQMAAIWNDTERSLPERKRIFDQYIEREHNERLERINALEHWYTKSIKTCKI
ncbi:replication initiation protein [Tortoise microvirus 49]|nr:replication initiation protein [Tortoise microvirus 49]